MKLSNQVFHPFSYIIFRKHAISFCWYQKGNRKLYHSEAAFGELLSLGFIKRLNILHRFSLDRCLPFSFLQVYFTISGKQRRGWVHREKVAISKRKVLIFSNHLRNTFSLLFSSLETLIDPFFFSSSSRSGESWETCTWRSVLDDITQLLAAFTFTRNESLKSHSEIFSKMANQKPPSWHYPKKIPLITNNLIVL